MSFIRKILLAFAVLTVASTSSAIAGRQDFTLVNRTGYPIMEVYVSSSRSDSWEEDVLGMDILEDRGSVNINFSRDYPGCMFDMMVVYSDGEEATWSGFDLCRVSTIRLFYNRRDGSTTAEYE